MDKPTVTYDNSYEYTQIEVGYCAYVWPVDHPNCSNTKVVMTSEVQSYDAESGEFETMNTKYIPKYKGE